MLPQINDLGPEDPVMIPLSHRMYALIDFADYDRVKEHTWHVQQDGAWRWSARTAIPDEQGKARTWTLQRFVLQEERGTFIHFANGNSLDCRRSNLIPHGRQMATTRKGPRNPFLKDGVTPRPWTPLKGVEWVGHSHPRKPWRAMVRYNGDRFFAGQHATPEEAGEAYDAMLIEKGGNPALTNRAIAERERQVANAAPLRNVPILPTQPSQMNSTGWRGVSYDAACGKWFAYIHILNPETKRRNFYSSGYFDAQDADLAARAYDEMALAIFGEDARLNFPRERVVFGDPKRPIAYGKPPKEGLHMEPRGGAAAMIAERAEKKRAQKKAPKRAPSRVDKRTVNETAAA